MNMPSPLLFAIKRYAIHDGPNIRTTVFFKGCPLRCFWCHNPESITCAPEVLTCNERCIGCQECITGCPHQALHFTDRLLVRTKERCDLCLSCVEICPTMAHQAMGYREPMATVLAAIERDRPFYDHSGGGVTFSGGEPLLQPEPLLALLQKCGERSLHRVVDTSGFAPRSTVLATAAHTDEFLYDIKHMDDTLHRQYTGVSNQQILRNLLALADSRAVIRLRLPLLAGINDGQANISATARLASSLPSLAGIDILPYHNLAAAKHRKLGSEPVHTDTFTPDRETLARVQQIFADHGLRTQIGG